MNNIAAVRKCRDYDIHEVYNSISDIYKTCKGPDPKGKKVLLKPNILSDDIPEKCISTNPVVVEAMIRFLQASGADEVMVGDSPAVHLRGFRPVKSGILSACEKTGAKWVDFTKDASEVRLRNNKIRIAAAAKNADIIISLPKLKNHELVYFTGAVKNTLGLVPGFTKAKQHALHQDRESFSRFLVELCEAVTPDFFLLDGIMGMEGHGPGQGDPFPTEILAGSTNPLALDIVGSTIAGYNPADIPTIRYALSRGIWMKSADDVQFNGPELKSLIKTGFKRIPITSNGNISLKFIRNRVSFLRKLEKRPDFIHESCTGCGECIKICPQNAIAMHPSKENYVVLTDKKCIRCFCCSEVCKYKAVRIRRKLFGA